MTQWEQQPRAWRQMRRRGQPPAASIPNRELRRWVIVILFMIIILFDVITILFDVIMMLFSMIAMFFNVITVLFDMNTIIFDMIAMLFSIIIFLFDVIAMLFSIIIILFFFCFCFSTHDLICDWAFFPFFACWNLVCNACRLRFCAMGILLWWAESCLSPWDKMATSHWGPDPSFLIWRGSLVQFFKWESIIAWGTWKVFEICRSVLCPTEGHVNGMKSHMFYPEA